MRGLPIMFCLLAAGVQAQPAGPQPDPAGEVIAQIGAENAVLRVQLALQKARADGAEAKLADIAKQLAEARAEIAAKHPTSP